MNIKYPKYRQASTCCISVLYELFLILLTFFFIFKFFIVKQFKLYHNRIT